MSCHTVAGSTALQPSVAFRKCEPPKCDIRHCASELFAQPQVRILRASASLHPPKQAAPRPGATPQSTPPYSGARCRGRRLGKKEKQHQHPQPRHPQAQPQACAGAPAQRCPRTSGRGKQDKANLPAGGSAEAGCGTRCATRGRTQSLVWCRRREAPSRLHTVVTCPLRATLRSST